MTEAGEEPREFFPGFRSFEIDVEGVRIHGRIGGGGPPLLLLHGHPQTHVMWHRVAGPLAERFTVVIPDLRGCGRSSKPPGGTDHAAYSKRVMAADQVAVMRELGFERFLLCGHDRGGRVGHRMAVDHPDAVLRLSVLDIAPTLAMYEQTDRVFATAYFHWFFLIQPPPFPERFIEAAPGHYVDYMLGRRKAGLAPFDSGALDAYRDALALAGAAHAVCEDYRASSTIDLEHDRADREAGRQIRCPLLVLWGEDGLIEQRFDALAEWGRVAEDVRGEALPCGHFLPEEAPDPVIERLVGFFA